VIKVSLLPVDHAPPPPSPADVAAFTMGMKRLLQRGPATLTLSGRAAMSALFRRLNLRRADEIFIATTFDLPNVSSCVTCTIFNFCKPSRTLGSAARAIFVIHEFGVPHPQTPELRREADRRGIPLIEDCAHTVASHKPGAWHVGELGDWAIVSLPKIFPTHTGGMLLGPAASWPASPREEAELEQAARIAAAWWPQLGLHGKRRRAVFAELHQQACAVGLAPLFALPEGVVPWFFPVHVPDPGLALALGRDSGVECGLWHGTDIVVYPCHQFLAQEHVAAVTGALKAAAVSSATQRLSEGK
jgi:hypothetical protein